MAGTGSAKPLPLLIGGQWVTLRAEPSSAYTQEQAQAQTIADWMVAQGHQQQVTPSAASSTAAGTASAQGQWQGPPVTTQTLDPHLELVALSIRGQIQVPTPYQPLASTLLARQQITQPTRTQPTPAAAQAGGDGSGTTAQGQWQGPGVPMTLNPLLLPLAARHALLIAPYVVANTAPTITSSTNSGAGLSQGSATTTAAVGAQVPTTGAFDAISSASATTAVGAEQASTGAGSSTASASTTTAVGTEQATAGAVSAAGSASATTAVGAEQPSNAAGSATGSAASSTAVGAEQATIASAAAAGDASATTAAGGQIAAGAASAAGDASATAAQGITSGGIPVVIQIQIAAQVPQFSGAIGKAVMNRKARQRQRIERDDADLMALAPHLIAHLNSRYGGSRART